MSEIPIRRVKYEEFASAPDGISLDRELLIDQALGCLQRNLTCGQSHDEIQAAVLILQYFCPMHPHVHGSDGDDFDELGDEID